MDWIEGDMFGMAMPTHPEALRAAGAAFLTEAFHKIGSLPADNAVAEITRFEDCPRGSTGRKVLLSVAYAKPDPALHTDLFVKFSRAFDDPLRDNQRYEMEDEARFAALSVGHFPIDVPACYFSDFHHESGTGMMITQCIPYGEGRNEPHYEKCLDWQMPAPLDHYRVIIETNGRLGAAHRAGKLSPKIDEYFGFDREAAIASDRIRYDEQKLKNRISRYAEFCRNYPQLLPANIRAESFHEALMRDVPRFLAHEQAIKTWLYSRPKSIVFAHWNANVDNAWFWQGDDGQRHCGFIDWGRVGQMSVAQALWGTLSGAEPELWDAHLDDLLALYVAQFDPAQGLDPAEIRLEMDMLIGLLGICWLLDAVPLILREIPDLDEADGRRDRRFVESERARTQLHMLTVFMNLWETHDLGRSLDTVLARVEAA
ncbi:hypothetical protein [Novosphingobium sp. JCM 18896]|uniref:hypothetical protein n=1 Tax=Novosphingobium sp. JCM 18896 TaxID=2989731 RepID=UPI002221DCA2|nr:hypothetical protein [Novosphingobium sp. JCM 18896]MCW1427526.1 hypothetical protein [Novosphingobium sp. JCM 18896]